MTTLNQRLTVLEGMRSKADIKGMSDDYLDAYINTLEVGSVDCRAAMFARLLRHPSAFPIVRDDPLFAAV